MSDKSRKPVPLDYRAAPSPKSSRTKFTYPGVAAAFGVLLGLFGAAMLLWGLGSFAWLIRTWNDRFNLDTRLGMNAWNGVEVEDDRRGDVYKAIMFTIIGVFCLVFCLRWTLGAERARRREEFIFVNEHRKTDPLPHYPNKWDENETERSERESDDAASHSERPK